MSQLDVLMLIPANLAGVFQEFAATCAIEPPVLALWIAGQLLGRRYSVEMIDTTTAGLTFGKVAEVVRHINPRLVVMVVYGSQPSASTQNMPAAIALSKAIKELDPERRIIFTGTHPSALPERTLRESGADFVVDGEGPTTIIELLEAIKGRGKMSAVRSLCRLEDGHFVRNLSETLLTEADLNRYPPSLAQHLWPVRNGRSHDWQTGYLPTGRTPYASINTTFGCPYKCKFCCINRPFMTGMAAIGKPNIRAYRFLDPKVVLAWIKMLVEEHGTTTFKFHDEMFVLNYEHVKAICDGINDLYGDRLNIWAYGRVDTVDERFLSMLRGAGFRWLGIGFEAANSKVRDGAKKSLDEEEIFAVASRIKRAGINIGANWIFGLPGDTVRSMEETLKMAIELNTPYMNAYTAMAYPGSPLHEEAQASGVRLPEDKDGPGWIGYSQHAYETQPLGTETLSPAHVLDFRDRAVERYYLREDYHDMMRRHFGEEAATNIREHYKKRLRRKLLGDLAA